MDGSGFIADKIFLLRLLFPRALPWKSVGFTFWPLSQASLLLSKAAAGATGASSAQRSNERSAMEGGFFGLSWEAAFDPESSLICSTTARILSALGERIFL